VCTHPAARGPGLAAGVRALDLLEGALLGVILHLPQWACPGAVRTLIGTVDQQLIDLSSGRSIGIDLEWNSIAIIMGPVLLGERYSHVTH